MTYIVAALGAVWGAYIAWSRKGKPLDILHYAAGFGICGAIVGMVLGVVIVRMGWML